MEDLGPTLGTNFHFETEHFECFFFLNKSLLLCDPTGQKLSKICRNQVKVKNVNQGEECQRNSC